MSPYLTQKQTIKNKKVKQERATNLPFKITTTTNPIPAPQENRCRKHNTQKLRNSGCRAIKNDSMYHFSEGASLQAGAPAKF